MLIHGGGNAWWNYIRQARALSGQYFAILPMGITCWICRACRKKPDNHGYLAIYLPEEWLEIAGGFFNK